MNKALMVSSVASMIDQFNMNNILILQKMGYQVDVASNFSFGNNCSFERLEQFKKELTKNDINYFNVLFPRKLTSIKTLFKSYKNLENILFSNDYKLIHCHSPIGGIICRLVANKYRKNGLKLLYTAHGFHFYKGSSFLSWILFYPLELFFSSKTDVLITINKEDFDLAMNKMLSKKIEYTPGIGINTIKFTSRDCSKKELRLKFGFSEDDIILISVGELNKNKNHIVVINALNKIRNKKIKYIIAGVGVLKDYYEKIIASYGLNDNIKLLGFRSDISDLLTLSDVMCFPSFREGLPVSLLEAMAAGLPLIASNIRGVSDCCENGINGYLCNPKNDSEFQLAILDLIQNKSKMIQMGLESQKMVSKFDLKEVEFRMKSIYSSLNNI